MTSSNRATVEFVSDARNQRQGFAGRFTFIASDVQPADVSAASDVTTHVTTRADHQADHRLLQPKKIAGQLSTPEITMTIIWLMLYASENGYRSFVKPLCPRLTWANRKQYQKISQFCSNRF